MRHHYLITDFCKEKMLRLPKNEEQNEIYKEGRYFMPSIVIHEYLCNIFEQLFHNKTSLEITDLEYKFSIDYQLSGSEILKLAYYGVTITEFYPRTQYMGEVKTRLADEVANLIKNGYYEEADKMYQLIKDL